MKFFIIILFAFILLQSCRTATFSTVNVTGFSQGKLAYPKVNYPDKLVEKKINSYIASAILGEEVENDSDFNDKLSVFAEYIYDLHHTATYNKNQVLSFNVFIESCGAFCYQNVLYFNFDLATGEPIYWTDLISPEIKDSFQIVLESQIKKELNEYRKSDLDSLAITDSSSFEWVMEAFQNCLENINVYGFAIYPEKIEFANECNFPRAIWNYAPYKDFTFSPENLAPYLKPKYLSLFNKK